jgi:hypothetical protein
MDCEFRKIEPNPVKSVQIPRMDVEYLGHVSSTSGGEKIQYPSRIEEINEEDKIQKMYLSQDISQTDRETISYSNPIYSSLALPQTTFGLSEYQSQQGGMGHLCPMEIQNDGRDQMVAKNNKNQQTSSYFDQSNFPSSDNDRCLFNSMESNFPSNKPKCKNKSNKRNGEINSRYKNIIIRTDNTAAIYNINRKSRAINLYHTAKKIWKLSERNYLILKAVHIPGRINVTTNRLSQLEMSGDYQLNETVFQRIQKMWHCYPKVDLFASKKNRLIRTYASVIPRGDSDNIGNALRLDWSKIKGPILLHPPIPLLLKVLRKFKEEGKIAVLIAPSWKG